MAFRAFFSENGEQNPFFLKHLKVGKKAIKSHKKPHPK
jgi:hypothetical protein